MARRHAGPVAPSSCSRWGEGKVISEHTMNFVSSSQYPDWGSQNRNAVSEERASQYVKMPLSRFCQYPSRSYAGAMMRRAPMAKVVDGKAGKAFHNAIHGLRLPLRAFLAAKNRVGLQLLKGRSYCCSTLSLMPMPTSTSGTTWKCMLSSKQQRANKKPS